MTHDDNSLGRLLSRREAAAWLGAAGAGCLITSFLNPRHTLAILSKPSCIVRPAQTEGPYFVDERLHRSDIRSDPADGQVKPGTPLALTFLVSRLTPGACHPIPGAQVDIWHCDAMGVYSDVRDPWFNTIGQKFLRGYQLTNSQGEARFVTIYPGWYPGRTVHIHFKIRTSPKAQRSYDFTSQVYFKDSFTDRVYTDPPYSKKRSRTVRNRHDRIFWRGGDQLMLTPTTIAGGYAATFAIGLQVP